MRLISGTPTALEEALAAELKSAQEADPLAPVGVLLGGTLQRPYLQRRMATLCGGIANVHFLMPSEFAMELGERSMIESGKRPLPPLADRILLREIAVELDGYFEPVRETPGLADAFHRLVRELRGAGYDDASLAAAIAGSCEVPEKEQAIRADLRRVPAAPRALLRAGRLPIGRRAGAGAVARALRIRALAGAGGARSTSLPGSATISQ